MDYATFLKLHAKLREFILNNNSIMCSPPKIRKHLLPTISYEQAQNITQHYRLYMKCRYELNRLILMIILYKYTDNEVFENSRGERQKTKDMNIIRHSVRYEVPALEKFMLLY